MIESAPRTLEEIAQRDPTLAALARLQAEALRSAAEPGWEAGIPTLGTGNLIQARPVLDGAALAVDERRLARLAQRLATLAGEQRIEGADRWLGVLRRDAGGGLAALEASIGGDHARLEQMAEAAGLAPTLLTTLTHLAAIPLLQACGHKAAPLLAAVTWQGGGCPVCGVWPTLAELRGLERQRWLRCGGCGSGWLPPHETCPFCGSDDHSSQGYLAAADQRDTRRAATCDRCHGYMKTLATLGALSATDLLAQDLTSVELDLAALERGYARPPAPPIAVTIAPLPGRKGWAPWSR